MPGTQYAAAASLALLSAIIAWAAIPLILRTKIAAALADTPDHRKVHSAPVPRVGGIAIIAATLAAALAWRALSPRIGAAPIPSGALFSILTAAAGIGALGLLDDSRIVNVRVPHKLMAAAALAAVTVFAFGASPGEISVFGLFAVPELAGKLLAALWIMALINAYNLVDGLDGFAGTVSILSLAGIAAVSHIAGCHAYAALSLFAAGAAAGFMVHNAPPAKVFMGDTGSCFLGYMIALLTIGAASPMGDTGKVPAVMPLLIGVPILEVAITILRRYIGAERKGVRRTLKFIVTADSLHLHHRFLLKGFSHLDACVLIGTLSATIVGCAVCAALAPLSSLPYIAAYAAIPITACLCNLGFAGPLKFLTARNPAPQPKQEPPRNIKLAGKRRRAIESRYFYTYLLIQIGLSLPVFALLIYLTLWPEAVGRKL
ncbi:MAG: undecaprenyl/decaprenyl-phosphate alpha-N-acetylglucosaminyl 1-phosphate transferase [Chitinispirillales bacterium]|jgi:UDP-GlcNAc:undecaprenyl-phosphate GlcNAc-1-phosphate transferase|nr:undecaprenyl/decaprenyl-phosphate alpha-N-acetylglucosaminyl 1-phosphate transferase [Chitinispirillales bacterium]